MIMHARMNERTNECMVHLCYQKTAGAMEPETYQVNAVIVCPDTKQEIHVAMIGAAVKPQVRTLACTAIYMRMILRTCLLALVFLPIWTRWLCIAVPCRSSPRHLLAIIL